MKLSPKLQRGFYNLKILDYYFSFSHNLNIAIYPIVAAAPNGNIHYRIPLLTHKIGQIICVAIFQPKVFTRAL